MKKLALLVGSILVVSVAASAKEVVKAPAVKPEVKVVEKVVVKEVPVEKVVYRDKVVYKETKPAWQPTGEFKLSYELPLYATKFETGGTHPAFLSVERAGGLGAEAEVTFLPKHTAFAKAKVNYSVVPHQMPDPSAVVAPGATAPMIWVLSSADKFDNVEVGYRYQVNDFAKVEAAIGADGSVNTPAGGGTPTVEYTKYARVAPSFEFKDYFKGSDNFSVTELSFNPEYKFGFKPEAGNVVKTHELSVGGKLEAKVPYDVKVGLDFNKFFTTDFTTHKGETELYAKKGFDVYENGNHKVNVSAKASAKAGWTWGAAADQTALNLGLTPSVKYTYKINDFASVYTSVSATLYANKANFVTGTNFDYGVNSKVKAGLNVKF